MKIGFVGIIIEGDRGVAEQVQRILADNSKIIIGRMGLPDYEQNIFMITVGIKGTNEQISAMTGRLGRLKSVKVKSAVSDIEVN